MFLPIWHCICLEIPLINISIKFHKVLCLPETKLYFYSTGEKKISAYVWFFLTHVFCIFFLLPPPCFVPFFNPYVTGIMQK